MSNESHNGKFAKFVRNFLILTEIDQYPNNEIDAEELVEYKYGSVLESFEYHGGFLDVLISKNNHEFKKDISKITNWIILYSINWMKFAFNDMSPEDNPEREKRIKDPSKAIKKDIKNIENFETLIKDRFAYMLKIHEGKQRFLKEEFKEFLNGDSDTVVMIQNILDGVEKLKTDLEEKHFKLFKQEEYYQMVALPKQELKRLLDDITEKHNIRNCSVDKKQLIDEIPSPEKLKKTITKENAFNELAAYLPDMSKYYKMPKKYDKTSDK